ncbi:MAG: sulfatase-like hydrolase/transferase, partial [Bacteroidota bacterium]
MKKYALLMAAVLVGTFFSCDPKPEEEGLQRPNILIILADDAGYADFGFMESEDMLTPNLDHLAQEGVVFTDAHTSASVCSPSRAGLLTGRYQQRFGHEMNLRPHQPMAFDSAQVTIAELLSQNGYQTSIFGKWHLGEAPHQHPNKNGFDHFWGFLAGHRSYFPQPKDSIREDMHLQENGRPSSFQGYLTDAIGDHALQYLEGINQDDPFFMFLSFNAPHTPMEADPMHDSLFKDHSRPVYASMMYSMDLAIGRIIRKLKEQELYNNSLIFFLSDNGGSIQNNSSVAPWKGFK